MGVGLTHFAEPVELLVSELLTNAIHASRSMGRAVPVRLRLLSDKAQVLVLVWDSNPQPPVRMDVSEDAESGRGLLLVEVTSHQWGCYVPSDVGGKVVWALMVEDSGP